MRISTKCSIAIHLLIVLAVTDDTKLTSEKLAKSTGCNPVVVRNILGSLKKSGFIDIQRGTGGSSLTADPKNITIWQIYESVDKASMEGLVGIHPNPSMKCPIGNKINTLLDKPYQKIAESVKKSMSAYTLQQLLDDYDNLNQRN